MSNWNKVNSEMYSLTDGPYHCIVRESGQMHYCEVFRNDDLILVSTVEDLQEAKNTCEVEMLADKCKSELSTSIPAFLGFKDMGSMEDAIKRHSQAAKTVEDGCKADAEQEPKRKFNWIFIAADYYCLLTDEFHVSVFTALDKWNLRIIERPSSLIVINSTLDECEDAKNMAEAFLKGYYEGPEAKAAHKTKNPEPFAVVEGWNIFVFHGRIPLSKKPSSWCFRAEKETSHATYYDFESENEAKAAALEWMRSFSYGCVDIEQPNPTEVEEAVIAQIRKRRDVGREKYGTTMEREDLSFIQWLQHLQEELLDAAIYAEKLKRAHRKELLSDMVADDENSGLYEA